jgi:hypothetical protein
MPPPCRLQHLTAPPLMRAPAARVAVRSTTECPQTSVAAPATSAIWKPNVAPVADDPRADLDQLLAQAGQRPGRRRSGHCQRAHEVTKVVSQHMRLGGLAVARQLSQDDIGLSGTSQK